MDFCRSYHFGHLDEKLIVSSTSKQSVLDGAYTRLRFQILRGDQVPGQRLKLDALSEQLKVSINTLREILRRLVSEGLVVAVENKGFTVAPVTAGELQEITEVRCLLECEALKKSIDNGDLDWEARVIAAHYKLQRYENEMSNDDVERAENWEKLNFELHDALISACNSPKLLGFQRAIYDQSLRYRMLAIRLSGSSVKESSAEHERLVKLSLDRDRDQAVALLRAHIRRVSRTANVDLLD